MSAMLMNINLKIYGLPPFLQLVFVWLALHLDRPGEGNSEVPQSDNAFGWAEMAFNGAYKERILDGCGCMFVGPL